MRNLTEWSSEIAESVKARGFRTPETLEICETCGQAPMLAKLMLTVTELAEATEEVRKGNVEAFDEEMADTFIRLMDICGAMGIDIHAKIAEKEAKNKLRPSLHGKTC